MVVLIGETVALSWVSRQLSGSWLTPFSVLAVPFTGVATLAYLFAPALGFVALYPPVVLIWAIGLFFFWAPGVVIIVPFAAKMRKRRIMLSQPRFEAASYRLVMGLAWVCIAILAFGILPLLARGGLNTIGDESVRRSLGSGLLGHTNVVASVLVIYIIGATRLRQLRHWLPLLLILAAAVLYGVKGWLIIPIISGIIYRIVTHRLRIGIKFGIGISLLGILLFFLVYLVRFAAQNPAYLSDPDTYSFLSQHFAKYFFAGVLGFGEMLKLGRGHLVLGGAETIFAPFVNLISALLVPDKPSIPIINQNYPSIVPFDYNPSNVPTLLGTLYLFLNIEGMLMYTVFLSLTAHFIFVIGSITRFTWLLVGWAYFASLLSMGWFEMYFWHLNVIEVPVIILILACVVWLRSTLKSNYAKDDGKYRQPAIHHNTPPILTQHQ